MVYCKNYKDCGGTTTDNDVCGRVDHECNSNCVFTCRGCEREEAVEALIKAIDANIETVDVGMPNGEEMYIPMVRLQYIADELEEVRSNR